MSVEIGPGAFVKIHYNLRDSRGNLLESTDHEEPHSFVWGLGAVVPGLEMALEGSRAGDVVNVTVAPEDAYGLRDDTDVFDVEREEFPDPTNVVIGQEFSAEGDDGTTLTMRVIEVHDDHVTVDANHPLAGETLNFQVEIVEVRKATDDELLAARAEITDARAPEGEVS
jgi:FKBP-type peptidyl-prolyl cis-trans isomerase SlyD